MKIKHDRCCIPMEDAIKERKLLLIWKADRIKVCLPESQDVASDVTPLICCPFCGEAIRTEFVEIKK